MIKRKYFTLTILWIFTFGFVPSIYAEGRYIVDPDSSTIKASVPYGVVGKYEAAFKQFEGHIDLDRMDLDKMQVRLVVDAKSIDTGSDAIDRVVRSKRVLHAVEYPEMIYQSKSFVKKGDTYFVRGMFDLHGVQKDLSFPFSLEGPIKDYSEGEYIMVSGEWKINRKDFGVVWNKLIDRGGVIVGNTVTLTWEIKAFKVNKN